jgi:hypothetical protein
MSNDTLARIAPVSIVGSLVLAACFGSHQQPAGSPAQPAREAVTIVPVAPGALEPTAPAAIPMDPSEAVVDLEMVDAPVKLILQRLADIGGLQLILPPNLNKTVSVQYIHVPVSIALSDVLKRANLRLGAGEAPNLPFDTVTVFYRLPANVDSMSADAIMRRFGVTRAMAELIVKSRRP